LLDLLIHLQDRDDISSETSVDFQQKTLFSAEIGKHHYDALLQLTESGRNFFYNETLSQPLTTT
jgi:hypothetical protein